MHIVGFFLIILLFVLLIALFIVLRIVFTGVRMFRSLRRGGKKPNNPTVHDSRTADKAGRKIFTKSDGEYVDFEEM